ncbi:MULTISPECIES: hypothetical protein [Methylomonas]|uniref:Uncharacterized protein n=1 Tax=Methylomonas methanica TaxID=421 RepID=A0A177MMF2_METMH|nr:MULTISPECIES: hypothetical protein [Methylomonas]OAI06978.1 hypothetical protein A1353_08035 [Methylomonas methanica]PKM13689.1 MAG: hypothetical protein CVV13_00370 [Gammaproteobacteria bacterium HGW-Gammaproteobacteria-3]
MMIHWHKSITITLVGVFFLLEGCAVTQPAFYRTSDVKPESIGQITLLPAVDARIDQQVAVPLEEPLRQKAATILKRKGYPVVLSNSGESAALTGDSLRAADPALIKRLGPPDARWIMVLALIDLNVVGSNDKVEVAGFLYDKEKGLLLWRDSVICLVGDGGILGGLINDKRVDLAVSTAVDSLLGSIPE